MKYKIPVYIETVVTKQIGHVECDSLDEFEDKANELWKSQDYEYPSNYACNDFDMGEWDIDIPTEDDLKYFEEQPNE